MAEPVLYTPLKFRKLSVRLLADR